MLQFKHSPVMRTLLCSTLLVLVITTSLSAAEKTRDPLNAPQGWHASAPRDEIRPRFQFDGKGGADEQGCFVIQAGKLEGQAGWWAKTFPVEGGNFYRFSALYNARSIAVPR